MREEVSSGRRRWDLREREGHDKSRRASEASALKKTDFSSYFGA